MVRSADLGSKASQLPNASTLTLTCCGDWTGSRRQGAVAMGLAPPPSAAARALVPKLAVVSSAAQNTTGLGVLMLSMGAPTRHPDHRQRRLTLAAAEPGTLVAELVGERPGPELALSTAAGWCPPIASADGRPVVGATRTYRRLSGSRFSFPT